MRGERIDGFGQVSNGRILDYDLQGNVSAELPGEI